MNFSNAEVNSDLITAGPSFVLIRIPCYLNGQKSYFEGLPRVSGSTHRLEPLKRHIYTLRAFKKHKKH